MTEVQNRQLLHLVFGGKAVDSTEFRDPAALHAVGIYCGYKSAYDAWMAAAQAMVDNALTRYFIVHMHKLLDPATDTLPATGAK